MAVIFRAHKFNIHTNIISVHRFNFEFYDHCFTHKIKNEQAVSVAQALERFTARRASKRRVDIPLVRYSNRAYAFSNFNMNII